MHFVTADILTLEQRGNVWLAGTQARLQDKTQKSDNFTAAQTVPSSDYCLSDPDPYFQ
jgi:hypothetical protein